MFGIGHLELLIILALGLVCVGVPIVTIVLIVALLQKRNSNSK